MRTLSATALCVLCVLPTVAFAKTQTFTATHTYILGDDDSRNSARQKCLAEAKRKILEQVGVYLESHSELVTSSQSTITGSAKSPRSISEERQQLTEQITTLTAGVMRAEVTKEEFGEVNGRLQITLTVKAEVDPDDIQTHLAAKRADQGVRKQVTEQAERLRKLEEQLSAVMKQTEAGTQSHPSAKNENNAKARNNAWRPEQFVTETRTRASHGDAKGQLLLGLLYQLGKWVPQDDVEAVHWYRLAADQGYAPAQFSLGWMYRHGKGVPQDDVEAVKWLRLAAAQGDANAQSGLGVAYRNGYGVSQDDVEAVKWHRLAGSQGNALSQFDLGVTYSNGDGVSQDSVEAVKWYRLAAAQGYAPAQNGLGWMYQDGKGVPQDFVEAVKWYRLAADQGDAPAQSHLAWMHRHGKGVPEDSVVAVKWVRLAAAQGDATAQFNLGVAYSKGDGIPQDNVKAYMWWNLAATQGHVEAVKKRDILARGLTAEQLAQGQTLASACAKRNYEGCE